MKELVLRKINCAVITTELKLLNFFKGEVLQFAKPHKYSNDIKSYNQVLFFDAV